MSKKVYKELADDELVIDTNFPQLHGFALFEPSIKVLRAGAALGADEDVVKVSSILVRDAWRKHGWLRLKVRPAAPPRRAPGQLPASTVAEPVIAPLGRRRCQVL